MSSELMIFEHKNHAVISSRVIADIFEKRHDNLITAIRELIEGILKNKETPHKYFVLSEYKNEQNNQIYTEYFCTRDGFSLLVMGFTGQKALEWKLKYIEAFNRMEAFLKERQSTEWLVTRKQGKLVRRNETDSIAVLIEHARNQGSKNMDRTAYTIYTKLVNGLLGIDAGQRDRVSFKTLSTIIFLEDMILHTIDEEIKNGTYYKEIYKKCKANGEQIVRFAYLSKSA